MGSSLGVFSLQSATLGVCQIDFPQFFFFFLMKSFPGSCRNAMSRALRVTKEGPGLHTVSGLQSHVCAPVGEARPLPRPGFHGPQCLHLFPAGLGQCRRQAGPSHSCSAGSGPSLACSPPRLQTAWGPGTGSGGRTCWGAVAEGEVPMCGPRRPGARTLSPLLICIARPSVPEIRNELPSCSVDGCPGA